MGFEIIEDRLRVFYKLDPTSSEAMALEHAVKEMVQEIALRGLALSGFFKHASFQGGTCLRIMHKMQRFSEDLDFTLTEPNPDFQINPYLEAVGNELLTFGLEVLIQDKSKPDIAVRKHMIATQSIEKILNIESRIGRKKKIRIKIEIDTNPPDGQKGEVGSIIWPSAFSIVMQDIPSLFAGKLHALLCRTYEKGRDWYDLIWYVQRQAAINFTYLKNALIQTNLIKKDTVVDLAFVKNSLKKKIESANLRNVINDVAPLVDDRRTIDLWTKEIFCDVIDRM